jgi:hypothetical protein
MAAFFEQLGSVTIAASKKRMILFFIAVPFISNCVEEM